jgi:hypothetical protein
MACLLSGVLAMVAQAVEPTPKAWPGKADKACPIYVGAYSVEHEFQIVTPQCLAVIRGKRILFGSRSWGLGLGSYLGNKDKKYALAWESYSKERVNDKDRVLKPDVLNQPKIVHYLFDPVPNRWRFLEDFLRKDPWKFGPRIDGAFQSLYCLGIKETQQMADDYFPRLDRLAQDFPNIQFAVFTHPVSVAGIDRNGKPYEAASAWNIGGGDYSDQLVKRYYAKLPIFDIRDIVSTHPNGKPCTFVHKGKTYRSMCPEYNVNQDMIHPNTPEARDRVCKGFLILLTKMFCADRIPKLDTPRPEILK